MKNFTKFNENRNYAQAIFKSYMAGEIDIKELMKETDGYEIATVKELEQVLKNKAMLHMTADDHDISVSEVTKRIKALLKEIT